MRHLRRYPTLVSARAGVSGVATGDDQPPDAASVLHALQHAGVGQRGHGQPGDAVQRLIVVERLRQHRADLGEESPFVRHPPLFGDVAEHDGEDQPPVDQQLRDRRLGRKLFAVLAQAGDLAARAHLARLLRLRREVANVLAVPFA